jgi:hypothetical protein
MEEMLTPLGIAPLRVAPLVCCVATQFNDLLTTLIISEEADIIYIM